MTLQPGTLTFCRNIIYQLIFIYILFTLPHFSYAAPSMPSVSNDQHALVIGISNYEQWPVLPNAIINSREIAWLLEKNGFTVTMLSDPDAEQLKIDFESLIKRVENSPKKSILVYYSGQGESTQKDKGQTIGWLIPKDCPRRQEDPDGFTKKALSTLQLAQYSSQIKARQVLMIFDSSFSADAFKVKKPSLRLPGATTNLPIRQYIIAGGQHEPIPDRSLFADHLIRGLLGEADAIKDDYITGSELSVYLSQELSRSSDSNRHLQYAVDQDKRFSKGDFVLETLQRPKETGRLYIDAIPEKASIRILNIKPKFKQGMDLSPGKYQISVSAQGFRTGIKWVSLDKGRSLTVQMTLAAISPERKNSLGMSFQWIDSGTFYMGKGISDKIYVDNEIPHTVRLTRGFYIQTTEVTVSQFSQFIKETGYRTDSEKSGCYIFTKQNQWINEKDVSWRKPPWKNIGLKKNGRLPATCVSWNDAQAFTKWLSNKEKKIYKLPTEAQWEFACRAGTKTHFTYGHCLTSYQANFAGTDQYFRKCSDRSATTPDTPAPVGNFEPNAWHLFDMHGNVAEWCRDWYGSYPDKMVRDFLGPRDGVEKVIRGGHFLNRANECRAARRQSFEPDQASSAVGFRVIMTP